VAAAAFPEPFLRQYQRRRATQRISGQIFWEKSLLLRHDRYELTSFRRPFCPPCLPGIAIHPNTAPAAQMTLRQPVPLSFGSHLLMVRISPTTQKIYFQRPGAQAEKNRVFDPEPYSLDSRLGLLGVRFRSTRHTKSHRGLPTLLPLTRHRRRSQGQRSSAGGVHDGHPQREYPARSLSSFPAAQPLPFQQRDRGR
jgi:hypothetical protein